MDEATLAGERCGYEITDSYGDAQPCDRPATGWRWYQDCDHEDTLDVACDWHANKGGQRIADAEAEVRRLSAALADANKTIRALVAAAPSGEPKPKPKRCPGTLGDRPSWMSPGQYDPCRCKLPFGHEGEHQCEHTNPELAAPSGEQRKEGQR